MLAALSFISLKALIVLAGVGTFLDMLIGDC